MATADLAQDVHIRQKIHLNPPLPLSLASLAASAGDVEGEPSRLVSTLARFRQHGVEIANLREDSGVGCRIRARRAPNRRLVDANDLVDIFGARDGFVRPRFFARAIQFLGQGTIENVIHQRGFARAGHSGNNRHHAQGKSDINILEIVLACAQNRDRRAVRLAALGTHLNPHPA